MQNGGFRMLNFGKGADMLVAGLGATLRWAKGIGEVLAGFGGRAAAGHSPALRRKQITGLRWSALAMRSEHLGSHGAVGGRLPGGLWVARGVMVRLTAGVSGKDTACDAGLRAVALCAAARIFGERFGNGSKL